MTTKPCLACGEPIQLTAKRCPHCHFHQDRILLFLSSWWAVALLLLLAFGGLAISLLREPVRWSQNSAAVAVSELKLRATDRRDSTDVSCSGLLKNATKHEWGDLVVEATFFASDNQAIDTITQRVRDVVLPADGEARVRVLDRGAWQAPEYARCTLSIRSAVAK